jgi:hypothetical protein
MADGGTVIAWGKNTYGPMSPPAPNVDFVMTFRVRTPGLVSELDLFEKGR